MTDSVKIEIGPSLNDLGRLFVEACERAEAGMDVEPQEIVSFESWSSFTSALNDRRIAIMKRLVKDGPAASIRALSIELGRDYAQVHRDISSLIVMGLVERQGTKISSKKTKLELHLNFDA